MIEKIKQYLEGKEFIVTPEFVDFREYHTENIYTGERTGEQAAQDFDALFLEFTLLKSKLVKPPLNWKHDFIFEGKKIDAKKIETINFNIKSEAKKKQFVKSILEKELDLFLFYKVNIKYDRPMIVGDKQGFSIISLESARQVIKNLNESTKEGYFYIPYKQSL